jgi:hypothetical protein
MGNFEEYDRTRFRQLCGLDPLPPESKRSLYERLWPKPKKRETRTIKIKEKIEEF